jgi:hypothetical protein
MHLFPPKTRSAFVPLECRIEEVSLDQEHLGYSAMSYAWDAEEPSRPLICNGKTILVTLNCENALRQFVMKPAGRVIWVDSICIDQNSLSERNHQVQLMGEIYQRADTVLIWLGEADQDAEIAFDQLRIFGETQSSSAQSSQPLRTSNPGMLNDCLTLGCIPLTKLEVTDLT